MNDIIIDSQIRLRYDDSTPAGMFGGPFMEMQSNAFLCKTGFLFTYNSDYREGWVGVQASSQ
ncbi:MAG: hypothetical protein C4518_16725 [Desulfobacteraceae bacterium]|nr:MAG: hypothetical protein C4518_16725 [Desulfobacteraceae bacterium]